MSVQIYTALVLLVAVVRLVELRVAKAHDAANLARGGREFGRTHYPVMVVLHVGLLVGCIAEVWLLDRPFLPWLGWPMLALLVAAHGCVGGVSAPRPQWTTRVIVVPGGLITSGPNRYLRHRTTSRWSSRASPCAVHTAWLTDSSSPPQCRASDGSDPDRGTGAVTVAHRPHVSYDADVVVVAWADWPGCRHDAARTGMHTIVVEQRPGTVDKACGEGLMPTAVARLRALGVRPAGQPFHGIRYVEGRHQAEAFFSAGTGLGVRRTALHAALAEAARSAGVHRVTGRVSDIQQDETSVTAAGVRARWLLAADGLHSGVRRSMALESSPRRPDRRPARYGLRRHVAIEPWTDLVEVHWSTDAEAYVTPVGSRQVGVAVLFSGRGHYDRWLERFPLLAERLRGVPSSSHIRGSGPLLQQTRNRVAGRVLLVGDAAGYVDALTGEGINVGLASAQAAVDCIRRRPAPGVRGALGSVCLCRTARSRRDSSGRATSRCCGRPIVPAATRFPRIFAAIVDRLAELGPQRNAQTGAAGGQGLSSQEIATSALRTKNRLPHPSGERNA